MPKIANAPDTADVIASMLTENTGRSILDSGSAYGRNFERNTGKTAEHFASRPEATLGCNVERGGEVWFNVTLDVYHWLVDRLVYAPRMDSVFQRFCERGEQKDYHYLQNMEEFPAWIAKRLGCAVGGINGDGNPMTVNTYNGEDLLSQVIQFVYFTTDHTVGRGRRAKKETKTYVILQIHGGCDVRGGYTRPRVFECGGNHGEEAIFDNDHASIYCDGKVTAHECANGHKWTTPKTVAAPSQVEMCPECMKPSVEQTEELAGHRWYADDGSNWYNDDGLKRLKKYPVTAIDEDADADVTPESVWTQGSLVVDERDHSGYCPECCGKLSAGAY